jgi:hypothetical protein
MLKITSLEPAPDRVLLKLEGRLVGPWVAILRQVAETELARDLGVAFDVSELSFVDREGEGLLRELIGRRVRLERPSGFVRELLNSNGGPR